MKIHSAVTTTLSGALLTLIIFSGYKFKEMQEQQKDIMLLQETVIGMSQMVIVQGIQLDVLQDRINKLSGIRTAY